MSQAALATGGCGDPDPRGLSIALERGPAVGLSGRYCSRERRARPR